MKIKNKHHLNILTGILSILLIINACTPETYDLILRNGKIYDGSGSESFKADIAIKNQKIAKISPNLRGEATREIDASNLVISPGFIDIHAHLEPLPIHPKAESHIRQGVTTALGGPDGSSPLKIGNYLL